MFKPTKYKLVNVGTGRVFEDEGWTLADPEDHLVVTVVLDKDGRKLTYAGNNTNELAVSSFFSAVRTEEIYVSLNV